MGLGRLADLQEEFCPACRFNVHGLPVVEPTTDFLVVLYLGPEAHGSFRIEDA